MNYWNHVSFFFTNICDLTTFLQVISFSLLCIIVDWPAKNTKKSVLIQMLKFIAVFGLYFPVLALFFGLDRIMPNFMSSYFFSFSFLLVPLIYLLVFLREDSLHLLIKVSLILADIILCNEMSRNLGLFIGSVSDNQFALVVFGRVFTSLLSVSLAIIMRVYDINKYKNLPAPIVAVTLITAYSLIIASIIDKSQNVFADNSAGVCFLFFFFYFVLLIILIINYYSLYYVVQTRHKLSEAEIQAELNTAEKEAMKIDEVNREELSKLRHDLNNQLAYVNILLNTDKSDEAKKYIGDLLYSKQEYLESFSCANNVVSSIMNLELTKAKMNNEQIKANVVVPPHLPFKDNDLCSLITNIIDNAIENNFNHSLILVSIITYKDYLRVSVINDIDPLRASECSTLKSYKHNRQHGYGTKIVKNISSSYNGYASFSVENNKFICDVVLDMAINREMTNDQHCNS